MNTRSSFYYPYPVPRQDTRYSNHIFVARGRVLLSTPPPRPQHSSHLPTQCPPSGHFGTDSKCVSCFLSSFVRRRTIVVVGLMRACDSTAVCDAEHQREGAVIPLIVPLLGSSEGGCYSRPCIQTTCERLLRHNHLPLAPCNILAASTPPIPIALLSFVAGSSSSYRQHHSTTVLHSVKVLKCRIRRDTGELLLQIGPAAVISQQDLSGTPDAASLEIAQLLLPVF